MEKTSTLYGAGERIVVFGYGAQGRAHALNLRDSGMNVVLCLRESSKRMKDAMESGIPIYTNPVEAAKIASVAAIMLPDGEQPRFYKDCLEENLPDGAALIFAHGYAIYYKQITPRPDLDVLLVAPLAQGDTVRSSFENGGGSPCIIATAQNASGKATARGHEYAKAISRIGPFIESTFKEEVETDLFAEQAVLCGGVPELIRASFETLTESGYNSEIAYFSCLRELHAITDLMEKHSIAGMQERISDTALYGALTRGPRIINGNTRNTLNEILGEIKSGTFTEELDEEHKLGHKMIEKEIQKSREHPIEKIHRRYSPTDR